MTKWQELSAAVRREKILAMEPGRELDSLVAEKVMGSELHWDGEEGQSYRIVEEKAFEEFLKPFNPSTDIAAAWEVAEKFHSWELHKLLPGIRTYKAVMNADPRSVSYSDSAPEAICKAALLAVLDKEEA